MRSLAPKQGAAQTAKAEGYVGLGYRGALFAQSNHVEALSEPPGSYVPRTGARRTGHDFSRVSVHATRPRAVQPKLTISTPGDRYEQEADRVAEQVLRMPAPGNEHACSCGGQCPRCQDAQGGHETLQATSTTGRSHASEVPSSVHDVLRAPGRPIDPATRAFFEPRLGHDFSHVRVHTDAGADASARALSARAYTVGSHIVFGRGQFAPATSDGKRLLAHELTHVVQQQRPPLGLPMIQRQDAVICEREKQPGVMVTYRGGRCRYQMGSTDTKVWQMAFAAGFKPDFGIIERTFRKTACFDPKRSFAQHIGPKFYFEVEAGQIVAFGGVASTEPSQTTCTTPDAGKKKAKEVKAPPQPTENLPVKGASLLQDPGEAIRQHPDYIEQRVKGVNTFEGYPSNVRFDLEYNQHGIATRSIRFPRTKVWFWIDPLAGETQLALGDAIHPSEAEAEAAAARFSRPGISVYGFYRGIDDIIFPTILSESTAPRLIAALRMSSQADAAFAGPASDLLLESFLLGVGLRYPLKAKTSAQTTGRLIMQSGANLNPDELVLVGKLVKEGRTVKVLAESTREGVRTADLIVDGLRVELKTISGLTGKDLSKALVHSIQKGIGQAPNIIADVRQQAGMTYQIADRAIRRLYGAERAMINAGKISGSRIQSVRVIGKGFDVTVPYVP